MSFLGSRIIFAAALFAAFSGSALAEPRLALIIGNSNYGGDLGKLPNPVNDAALMEKSLRDVGFEILKLTDADQKAMKRGISDFGRRLTELGSEATGLFFYAGHGLQVGGTNYLVPVNADIRGEADVDLEAVAADTVLSQMEYAGARVNIVILDACRNNPLSRGFRSVTRGLAKMDAPRGSFVAYSTAPGDVAADGTGANSPYTAALAAEIRRPGKGIEEMFRDVRGEVLKKTGEAQTPWESSSLTAPFYFNTAKVADGGDGTFKTASAEIGTDTDSTVRSADQVASIDPKMIENNFWQSVQNSTDPADFEAYLAKYPNGEYASLAKIRLDRLRAAAKPAASEPAATTAAIDPGASIIAGQQLLYAKANANIRTTPTKNGKVLVRLPARAELNVTGQTADGAWYRVTLQGGQIGYVHQSVVTDQAPLVASTAPANTAAPTATANNESFGAAPSMADAGTITRSLPAPVVQQPSATDQQMNAALNGFLGGLTGQSSFKLPPVQSVPVQPVQRRIADPRALDSSIVAQLASGNAAGAAQAAGVAQTEDPGFWSKSAMMAFYANSRPDLAVNMARRAVQDNPGYLYGWIWMAMGSAADGNSGAAAQSAQEGISNFGQSAWPVPVAEFLAGNRSLDALLAVAGKGSAKAVQLCQANYYAGALAWRQGDRGTAQSLLQKALSGGRACPEAAGAQALLRQ